MLNQLRFYMYYIPPVAFWLFASFLHGLCFYSPCMSQVIGATLQWQHYIERLPI